VKVNEEINRNVILHDVTEEGGRKGRGKKEKSLLSRIINVVLWIVLLSWMGIVFSDYARVNKKEAPRFCWNEKVNTYDDGKVTECTGLGYKVIIYSRTTFKAYQFGPFWIKEREVVISD
ncbi:MAG: hypothetical protein K2M17_00590, partial [Bacilli bacterium]|nr:hypothetical protein [Bacilli bacterium]